MEVNAIVEKGQKFTLDNKNLFAKVVYKVVPYPKQIINL